METDRTASVVYEYRDESGRLLYEVRRFTPKRFRVVSTTGRTLTPVCRYRHVPYRLPDLRAADPGLTVFVVEGEKDVDRLWKAGLPATCNAFGGGKGKWTRGHSAPLRGRPVAVLPDNDPTGEEHAQCVARGLSTVAARVRLVRLPGLPPKGDVSDWLDAGGSPGGLLDLVEAAPVWSPTPYVALDRRDFHDDYAGRLERERILNSGLAAQEKLLLLVLSDRRDQPPTQAELSHCVSLLQRRVRQLLDRLVAVHRCSSSLCIGVCARAVAFADHWRFRPPTLAGHHLPA